MATKAGPPKRPGKRPRQAAPSVAEQAEAVAAMDRASGRQIVDPRDVDKTRLALRQASRAAAASGDAAQASRATALDAALADVQARVTRSRSRAPRAQRAERVRLESTEELGIEGLAGELAPLEVGAAKEEGVAAVRPGGTLGVMYEAESDSDFESEDWGPGEGESPDFFDELLARDAESRVADISAARKALAHRRAALEGRALQVGADPKAARALVRAGSDPQVTAPTMGRRRRSAALEQIRETDEHAPVEAPIPGSLGRRRMSLEVRPPRLRAEPPTDPAVLPETLPEPPVGMTWQWVPETHTGLPRPQGWNAAKGWGSFLGTRVLSAVVTPEDPLVLNTPDPVVRGDVHAAKEAARERLRREAEEAGAADDDANLTTTDQVVDGRRVVVLRDADDVEPEPEPEPARVTAPDPSLHFLRVGLTYRAYLGAFTTETIDASDPKALAQFFLSMCIRRFLPPTETAGQGGDAGAGDAQEALTGVAPAPGAEPWTQDQLMAAMDAKDRGEDPIAAAERAGRAGHAAGDGSAAPAVGFRYDAFPHIDRPEAPVEPRLEDQWAMELVPGRVYGYGAIASVGWSPMGPDDPSHRLHGGMRFAVAITMDREANVVHEAVFRAPVCIWPEAWAEHGEAMLDDVCINWQDGSSHKFA